MKTKLFLLICVPLMIAGCTSPKEIIYFQDINDVTLQQLTTEYEAKIKKDDMLSIIVSGPDKQVVQPYNLTLSENANYGGSADPEKSTLPYLVNPQGEIDFPIFGKIYVEGMTRSELVAYLTERISKDVKDPVVYISFKNYKITVLGEVRNPGTYTMDSERISILQALGKAGDLLISAERDNIILIREVKGAQTYHRINLKSAQTLNSDCFYMQQNDVLYIPPSASRVATGTTATSIWSIVLSTVTSIVAVISLILANTR